MIYLTLKDSEIIKFSDELLLISDYFSDIIKSRVDETEIIEINVSTDIFNIFLKWFELLQQSGIVKIETDMTVIFKPDMFKDYSVQTLIDIFNFGFSYKIRMLCETVAYAIGLKQLEFKTIDDKFYINDCLIHRSLLIMILKNSFCIPEDFKKYLTFQPKQIIDYTPYINESYVYTNTQKQRYTNNDFFIDHTMYEDINNMYKHLDTLPSEHYIIPYNISEIPNFGFSNKYNVVDVVIPNTVTYIGYRAFENCYKLKNIIIPDSVVYIDESAFTNCYSLTKLVIPEKLKSLPKRLCNECIQLNFEHEGILYSCCQSSIPTTIKEIGYYAFSNCTTLSNVEIPNSVTKINDYAFNSCYSLIDIKLPESIKFIGNNVFQYCKNLRHIDIPIGVNISKYAFTDCPKLNLIYNNILYKISDEITNYTIPDYVTEINEYAFENCESLENIKLNNISEIPHGCFKNCINLCKIEFPDSIIKIKDYAFYGCSSLTSIKFSKNIERIGSYAFSHCKSLTHIKIPLNVDVIESYAFESCENLKYAMLPACVKLNKYVFHNCGLIINTNSKTI